jgi:hypothetical protein
MNADSKLGNANLRETTIIRLIKAGAPVEDVIDVIRKLYIADKEDWDQEFVQNEVYQYQALHAMDGKSPEKSVQNEVEDWLHSNTSNKTCYQDVTCSLLVCYSDLGYTTPQKKAACRMAFKRLVERGKMEPIRNRSGIYRYMNGKMEDIDFLNADCTPFPIKFPLGVHELVEVYKKSIIVIAGEPNAGKTAYLLNVAKKNMADHDDIMYFSSEMGAAELQIRLKKFNIPLTDWSKVRFIAKNCDFKDVVNPNGLNIIDYLEVAKDFYEIGGLLTDIFNAKAVRP